MDLKGLSVINGRPGRLIEQAKALNQLEDNRC
jgi:hypothetical protein